MPSRQSVFQVALLSLRPTQFAVGMLEVDEKIKAYAEYSKKEKAEFVKGTQVPVVRGPDKNLYVVDKHHFLCVCYHVGIAEVSVKVIKSFASKKISYSAFWKWMSKSRNSYPYCQFGEGPRSEIYLPKDIRGLADDPYRSLAWFVRKSGAFENSDRNFAEFTWANFFRSKKLLEKTGMAGLEKALVKAVHLSQSEEAKELPGYDKLKPEHLDVAKEKARKKAVKIRNNTSLIEQGKLLE